MDGNLMALQEALMPSKKLFRVCCERKSEREKLKNGEWLEPSSVGVISTSMETAQLKAVQFLNKRDGADDFEVREIRVTDDVIIE